MQRWGQKLDSRRLVPSSLPHVVDLTAILNWDGFPGYSLCYGGFVAKDDQKRKPQDDERRKPGV
jgi:hypothetical protein